jgi:hypothetical protein
MVERRVTHTAELPFPDQRKRHEPSMIELLTFINHQISDMRTELSDHMRDETAELAKSVAAMMHEAFPGGDPVGHRKHHEAVIKAAEAKAAFWQDMSRSLARWGLIGFSGWLIYVAWAAFVKGPQ